MGDDVRRVETRWTEERGRQLRDDGRSAKLGGGENWVREIGGEMAGLAGVEIDG